MMNNESGFDNKAAHAVFVILTAPEDTALPGRIKVK